MTRPSVVERFLADMAELTPLERAQVRREAAFDAMCADMFDLGAGRATSFRRLNAMRLDSQGERA
ncbi:MAG: hypothetical protein ACOYBT_09785 [Polynucleobacter sp.]